MRMSMTSPMSRPGITKPTIHPDIKSHHLLSRSIRRLIQAKILTQSSSHIIRENIHGMKMNSICLVNMDGIVKLTILLDTRCFLLSSKDKKKPILVKILTQKSFLTTLQSMPGMKVHTISLMKRPGIMRLIIHQDIKLHHLSLKEVRSHIQAKILILRFFHIIQLNMHGMKVLMINQTRIPGIMKLIIHQDTK
jgi:hypothetical protein